MAVEAVKRWHNVCTKPADVRSHEFDNAASTMVFYILYLIFLQNILFLCIYFLFAESKSGVDCEEMGFRYKSYYSPS